MAGTVVLPGTNLESPDLAQHGLLTLAAYSQGLRKRKAFPSPFSLRLFNSRNKELNLGLTPHYPHALPLSCSSFPVFKPWITKTNSMWQCILNASAAEKTSFEIIFFSNSDYQWDLWSDISFCSFLPYFLMALLLFLEIYSPGTLFASSIIVWLQLSC